MLALIACAPLPPAKRHEKALDACARDVQRAAEEAARREPLFRQGRFRRDADTSFFIQPEIKRKPLFEVAVVEPMPLHEPRVWPMVTDWRLRYLVSGHRLAYPLNDRAPLVLTSSGDVVSLENAGVRVGWFWAVRVAPGERELSMSAQDVTPAELRVLISTFRPVLDACADSL